MKEIDKLFADGVTLEEIQKAYAEAGERAAAADKRKKDIEKSREKFICAGLLYLKSMGLDLTVESCSEVKNELSTTLSNYEKIMDQMLNEDINIYKSKSTREKEKLINALFDDLLDNMFRF